MKNRKDNPCEAYVRELMIHGVSGESERLFRAAVEYLKAELRAKIPEGDPLRPPAYAPEWDDYGQGA